MTELTEVGQDESFYEMANLFPKHTGLPFVVWISIRGGARHDVRVKVAPGPTMDAHDLDLLTRWIEQNQEVILRYWNEEIDTVEAIQNLKRLQQAQPQSGDRSAAS